MTAQSMMTTPVVTVHPETTLEDAARLLLQHKIANLPVVDDEHRLLGIVTESDVFRGLGLRLGVGASPTAHLNPTRLPVTVRDVMHRTATRVKRSDGVAYCLRLLDRHDGHALVVVEKGEVLGVISRRDALRVLMAQPGAQPTDDDDDPLPSAVAASDWMRVTT